MRLVKWCNHLRGSEDLTEAGELNQPGVVERCECSWHSKPGLPDSQTHAAQHRTTSQRHLLGAMSLLSDDPSASYHVTHGVSFQGSKLPKFQLGKAGNGHESSSPPLLPPPPPPAILSLFFLFQFPH